MVFLPTQPCDQPQPLFHPLLVAATPLAHFFVFSFACLSSLPTISELFRSPFESRQRRLSCAASPSNYLSWPAPSANLHPQATMSRYRSSNMEFDYSGPPPQSQRWDASRFSRESQHRRAPVIEERPPYYGAPRRAETSYYDEEQDYYERDVRGPRGDFRERRYFEEDDYYDPRAGTGAMVPFRPERPSRPSAPPRPAMVRRQSSVDRIDFERRQSRRYYDDYRPPPPAPPADYRRPRQDSRYYYDDVRVSDPDYYGDDGFREYREREWVRTRSRNDSPSPDRRAPTAASIRSSRHSEFVEAAPPEEERVEEHFEERVVEEEKVVEKPYPRRGKTRMPKRLVHTKVLFDLGYSFYEEVRSD